MFWENGMHRLSTTYWLKKKHTENYICAKKIVMAIFFFATKRDLEGSPEQIPETSFDDDDDLVFPATTTRLFFHLT
jgi:hypothetical protein